MPSSEEKVLVTGGAGYIGSVLVPELLRAGHAVTVIDNFRYGQTSLLDCCHYPQLRIVCGDAGNIELLARELPGVDWIFPLAGIVGAPACDRQPGEAKRVNRDAVGLLLNLRGPQQKIIFPATNSGYGIGQPGIACDETTSLKPISLYGQLKVEAEKAVLAAGNSVTLRLATVFGVSPRMRLDLLVNDFVYRAVTDRFVIVFEAHFKRNYIHIRDVVRAFLHTMTNFKLMTGEPYNVGLSDANLSKLELCREIQKQVPDFYYHEAKIGRDPDQRNYLVSNAKIKAAGFRPKVSLAAGIAELIKGYQVIQQNQFSNF